MEYTRTGTFEMVICHDIEFGRRELFVMKRCWRGEHMDVADVLARQCDVPRCVRRRILIIKIGRRIFRVAVGQRGVGLTVVCLPGDRDVIVKETIPYLQELREQGVIKAIGLSAVRCVALPRARSEHSSVRRYSIHWQSLRMCLNVYRTVQ